MVALRSLRPSAPSFADLVPYAGLVDNGTILLKDGSLMAGWYFAGPDSESATDFERNDLSRQINTILSRLGSGWMIQVEAVRIPTTDYPSAERSHFPDAVTRMIDDERRKHFEQERGHFESRHALVLTYRPPERRRSGVTRYIYSDTESRTATYACHDVPVICILPVSLGHDYHRHGSSLPTARPCRNARPADHPVCRAAATCSL